MHFLLFIDWWWVDIVRRKCNFGNEGRPGMKDQEWRIENEGIGSGMEASAREWRPRLGNEGMRE